MNDVLTGTPELDQMQSDFEVAGSAFETISGELRRAMAGFEKLMREQLADVESGVADLTRMLDTVPDAIEKIAVARGSAKVAAYHTPSVKLQGEAIVAAIKQIASWERSVLKLQTEAQQALAGMDRAMDARWKQVFAFHEHVTQALAAAGEVASIGPSLTEAMASIRQQAQQRVEQRNPDGLSLQQSDARGLDLKRLKASLARLVAEHDAAMKLFDQVGPNPQRGRKAHLDEVKRARADGEKWLDSLQAMLKDVLAMKAVPIDIAKAMKVLGLPSQHKAALAQALAKPPKLREKALDDVARQAKVALKGKAWLDALERAKVV